MLKDYLSARKEQKPSGKPLLMTHVVCGYPNFEENWQELEVMQAAGVDLVELQFPFSEPSADGPLFVKANQEAVEKGVTVDDCFAFMEKVTSHFDFKVAMMGYYNTVFKTGHKEFMTRLAKAGACAYILPDLPIEEASELHEIGNDLGLAPIVLMTPTSSDERLKALGQVASGFVYVVARKGVTGSDTNMNTDLQNYLARCRVATSLPLAVGFGVSQAEDIKFIGEHADIAVIGTAALRAWESGKKEALQQFFEDVLA